MGWERGEQQENSDWDSAVRSVVARAERMACCVWQRQYCVSGFSLSRDSCIFFFELDRETSAQTKVKSEHKPSVLDSFCYEVTFLIAPKNY